MRDLLAEKAAQEAAWWAAHEAKLQAWQEWLLAQQERSDGLYAMHCASVQAQIERDAAAKTLSDERVAQANREWYGTDGSLL